MDVKPDCKKCQQPMTKILQAESVDKLAFKGWYCLDCRFFVEAEPPYTIDQRTGEKHLLNGH